MTTAGYHVSVWRTSDAGRPDILRIQDTLQQNPDTSLEHLGLVARVAVWRTVKYPLDWLMELVSDSRAVGAIDGGTVSVLAAQAGDFLPALIADARDVKHSIWLVAADECAPDEWLVFLVMPDSSSA